MANTNPASDRSPADAQRAVWRCMWMVGAVAGSLVAMAVFLLWLTAVSWQDTALTAWGASRSAMRRLPQQGEAGFRSAAPETAPQAGVASSDVPQPPAPPHPDGHVGVYLTAAHAGDAEYLERTLHQLLLRAGDALVFDVKGSYVLFPTSSPLASELDLIRPAYELPTLLAALKARGVYTIARFIAMKDGGFTARVPGSLIVHPKTGQRLSPGWIDPAHDTALEYNRQLLCELAAAGVAEINLDYIRFSTAFVGPLRVFSGSEKADRVERFVRMAREVIDTCGPQTKLGISTYAILGWDYARNLETLGQDVVRFAPSVDVISPMTYPSTFAPGAYYVPGKHPRSRSYYLVHRTLEGYKELLGEQAWKLRPWIQGYSMTAAQLREEMDAVADAGLCGFTVWSASNTYEPLYAALERWQRPEGCQ